MKSIVDRLIKVKDELQEIVKLIDDTGDDVITTAPLYGIDGEIDEVIGKLFVAAHKDGRLNYVDPPAEDAADQTVEAAPAQ